MAHNLTQSSMVCITTILVPDLMPVDSEEVLRALSKKWGGLPPADCPEVWDFGEEIVSSVHQMSDFPGVRGK
jgi:hypothetical protein